MADSQKAKEHPGMSSPSTPKSLGYFEALKPMNIVKAIYYLCYYVVQAVIILVFKPVRSSYLSNIVTAIAQYESMTICVYIAACPTQCWPF